MASVDLFLGAGSVVAGIFLYYVITKGWVWVSTKISTLWNAETVQIKAVVTDLEGRVTALEGKVASVVKP